jgi:hypothetical protein
VLGPGRGVGGGRAGWGDGVAGPVTWVPGLGTRVAGRDKGGQSPARGARGEIPISVASVALFTFCHHRHDSSRLGHYGPEGISFVFLLIFIWGGC